MATKIKVVTAGDFLEVTPEGVINLDTSRQLLVDIARATQQPVDYDLLIDFRDTKWHLSTVDLYRLASELTHHAGTFNRKVALLVFPGDAFDSADFFETCAHNRGFAVDAFTDYESAMRWLLLAEDAPNNTPPTKVEADAKK